ncbi:MAG TPA: branched-chain amino acid ABC transporter substrate-binding protein [Candidatus Dormibacteraeota bacterium]
MGLLSVTGAILVGAVSACGTSSSGGGGSSSCTGTVTVATELPTSGADASDGVPTQNGAQLAVTQANNKNLLNGCKVNLVSKDDASVALGKHDPNQGAANMTALAANQAVVGVVGPFNSSVCQAEMPIANNAGLAQISPSCTNPGLTIPGSNPTINTTSLRPTGKITFFRVCTTDIAQSAGLAAQAKTLGASKAFVFDDQETYGQGLANNFAKDFQQGGGTVVGTSSLPGTTTDFTAELAQAKSKGADIVFFGGTSSNGGGKLKAQMSSAGLGSSVLYMGGDGIVDTEFITDAGSAAAGAYGTTASPDATKLSSAASFASAYQSAYGSAPGAYSANAYDAMNIILTAVKDAISANGGKLPTNPTGFRESVRSNVASISYSGAIGHTTFDSNGDTGNKILTLYQVTNNAWTSIKNLTVS